MESLIQIIYFIFLIIINFLTRLMIPFLIRLSFKTKIIVEIMFKVLSINLDGCQRLMLSSMREE